MKDLIELYINGQKVHFTSDPNILFTYSHSDLHNPTIIKNSFSKTLTIEGTPANDRIFNNFYDMRRVNNGSLFNPSRKEKFELYRNGERFESGYVRLDSVNRTNGKTTYNISLFGGLGEFLYNISYKDNGDPLRLSDLEYGVDFNMTVNKDTVYNAWKKINGIDDTISDTYDVVNFAPCYNGIPDEFTSDKVAVDVDSFTLNNPQLFAQFKLPEGTDSSFTTVNGWVSGEMPKEYDEWETKDLRAYLQRPVLRFKNVIQACCNPAVNGGYTVDLDPDFFNENNPYYENAWMTLPLVREIEGVMEGTVVSIDDNDRITFPSDVEGYMRLSVNTTLVATPDFTGFPVAQPDFLWTGIIRRATGNAGGVITAQYNRAYCIQVVVYDANDNVVAVSPCNVFYTAIGQTTDFDIQPVVDANINVITGQFDKQLDGRYVFNGGGYDLATNTFKYESGMYGRVYMTTSEIKKRGDYDSTMLFTNIGRNDASTVKSSVDVGFSNELLESRGELGYYLNKQKLLNTEKTPCDYFLSYVKMFNLHLWKDTFDDIIYIRQRKNYFTGDIIDIEDLVDENDIKITPIVFQNKWLNLNAEVLETGLSETYKNEYGVDFGGQRIDTNYNFDTSTKELLENYAFKTTIQTRKKSKYYVDIYQQYEDDDVYYPPFMLDGLQPVYFNASGDTTEGEYIGSKWAQKSINWWQEKYYDFMSRPLFADAENKPVEGDGVLLFYSGKVETKDISGKKLDFQLTDDIPEFEQLNEGEPCWIWTMDRDVAIFPDYLPSFSRYILDGNNWVTHSWDFGTPRQLYVPEASIDNTSSVYGQYWRNWITDLYDSDTRKVETKVLLKNVTPEEWLMDFYYWNGRYWLLNKIIDYNTLSDGLTKCELISINDTTNYLS